MSLSMLHMPPRVQCFYGLKIIQTRYIIHRHGPLTQRPLYFLNPLYTTAANNNRVALITLISIPISNIISVGGSSGSGGWWNGGNWRWSDDLGWREKLERRWIGLFLDII